MISGATAVASRTPRSLNPATAGTVGPVIVRCTISRMYSAARTMPSTANEAYHGLCVNAPSSTRNSLMKGERPGSDSDDRPATRKIPARTGATFSTPPKSGISFEPRRLIRKPLIRNSAAVESPWLNM